MDAIWICIYGYLYSAIYPFKSIAMYHLLQYMDAININYKKNLSVDQIKQNQRLQISNF